MRSSAFVLNLLLVVAGNLLAQTTGDFRSVASGIWTVPSTWETFNGTSWIPATIAPSTTDGAVAVRTTHLVTVDTMTAADQVVVETGATLVVGVGVTFTVADGADSIDCVVQGAVQNFGTIAPSGRLSFENGAFYYHLVPGGAGVVPTSTWRDGSSIEIDSAGNGGTIVPTNITSQSYYNFIWNSPRQAGNIGLNFPDGYVFRGGVTITNTGGTSRAWRLTNLSAGQAKNIFIRGDVNVNGPNAMLTSTGSTSDTAARAIINVDGDVNLSDGMLYLVGASNPYGEWRIKGNVNISGGQLTGGGAGAWRRILSFTGTGDQNFSKTGGSIAVPITIRVANPASSVNVNFPLDVNGILELNGGRFVTNSSNLLTIKATGSIAGGSETSYVEGPLALEVNASLPILKQFPIGKGSSYRPVEMNVTMTAATTTAFTAEVIDTAPPERQLPPAFRAVSAVRHYSIVKGVGASISSGTVTLAYGLDDKIDHKDSVRIATDDGAGNWVNLGGSGTADSIGSITSNVVTSFGELFTLAFVSSNIVVSAPTVSTTPIDTNTISITTANGGGYVTNDGGGAITQRGVCWNTMGSPTIADSTTDDGSGAGFFASALSGLIPGMKYYVRAYATNSGGTGYGAEVVFTTMSALTIPTVTTASVTNIVNTTARSGGIVAHWGGTPVTEGGVCWSTEHDPTVADERTVSGSGLGAFTSAMGGLRLGTTYYVRAFATNSTGTGYGEEVEFTTPVPQPNVTKVVSKDGRGDYTTIQAAFDAVTANYTGKWYIYVKKGIYYEKALLAAGKINVILVGEDRDSTILTHDDYSGKTPSIGTSTSYSVGIDADDFEAQNITFQNTATQAQAVALRINGDRSKFYDCNMLGYQDTYLTNSNGRIYHRNCLIQGSVDFIFGSSVAVFDSCRINCNRNGGTLTAASTNIGYKFGYVFMNCALSTDVIGFDGNPITSFILGRPWQNQPRTVFLNSYEPATLSAAGWSTWNVIPALYAEYNCYGPGSDTTNRIRSIARQLTDEEAATYTISNIFGKNTAPSPYGGNWLPERTSIDTSSFIVSVDEDKTSRMPQEFKLSPAYPNPFNPKTQLEFTLDKGGWTTLRIFNLLGQQVRTLFEGNAEMEKLYRRDFTAEGLRSGLYFARLESDGRSHVQKLVLLK